ncbi:major facilitator superfamily domain-containing protein 9-like isoform X1 [Asterias rubens]|uniref:major facilitator superfamily domain-containing protein 9-like isoform X1 n=1 Tax=Asterias rubens TaxID=7604 RepID=UPI0014554010|nr:major facilitator superfamily domain-containing protein 9-like isoform X1 [Asterias rubens]
MAEEKKENAGQTDHQYKEVPTKTMDQRHRMYLTSCLYLVGFLDLFGVSMLLPLLPHHARQLGASPMWIGAVGSVYGVLQLFSGPLVGRFSDVFGRRKILLVCLFMSAVGYTINIFAVSVVILIFARIPLGIFKHGISTVRAFLAEITPRRERPLVFGRFNAISNVGFIIGPLCGGHLAEYNDGFYHVAMCTSAIFFLNLFFVYILVHHKDSKQNENNTTSKAVISGEVLNGLAEKNFFQSFGEMFKSSGDLLLVRFLIKFSVMMYYNNFTLILAERFHTTPKVNGWLMSYSALTGALSGLAVGKIVKFYNDLTRLVRHLSFSLVICLFGLTTSPSLSLIVFWGSVLSLTTQVLRVCMTDLVIRRGRVNNTGALLGISQSVASVSRSVSPFLSGVMLEVGPQAPGAMGVICAAAAAIVLMTMRHPYKGTGLEKEKDL